MMHETPHHLLRRRRAWPRRHTQQRGVALFMVLMVSLIVALLSIALASGMINETRTTMTLRDQTIARQAAEAALRDAERDIACLHTNDGQNFYFQIDQRAHCTQDPAASVAESVGLSGTDGSGNCTEGFVLASGGAHAISYHTNSCFATYGSKTGQPAFPLVGKQPRYTIEVHGMDSGKQGETAPLYRIRARGFGRNAYTQVDMEAIFRPM
jgi:type IV pilus assembly protein PilX